MSCRHTPAHSYLGGPIAAPPPRPWAADPVVLRVTGKPRRSLGGADGVRLSMAEWDRQHLGRRDLGPSVRGSPKPAAGRSAMADRLRFLESLLSTLGVDAGVRARAIADHHRVAARWR